MSGMGGLECRAKKLNAMLIMGKPLQLVVVLTAATYLVAGNSLQLFLPSFGVRTPDGFEQERRYGNNEKDWTANFGCLDGQSAYSPSLKPLGVSETERVWARKSLRYSPSYCESNTTKAHFQTNCKC